MKINTNLLVKFTVASASVLVGLGAIDSLPAYSQSSEDPGTTLKIERLPAEELEGVEGKTILDWPWATGGEEDLEITIYQIKRDDTPLFGIIPASFLNRIEVDHSVDNVDNQNIGDPRPDAGRFQFYKF